MLVALLDRLRLSRFEVPEFVRRNPCHLPYHMFIGIANDLLRHYDPFYRPLNVCPLVLCRDPPPSPSLISTSLRVYERLTSLTGGIYNDA